MTTEMGAIFKEATLSISQAFKPLSAIKRENIIEPIKIVNTMHEVRRHSPTAKRIEVESKPFLITKITRAPRAPIAPPSVGVKKPIYMPLSTSITRIIVVFYFKIIIVVRIGSL